MQSEPGRTPALIRRRINEMSLCECGCGKEAGVYKQTILRVGAHRGQPKRFYHGSHSKTVLAKDYRCKGYKEITVSPGNSKRLHVALAEKALGKPLPKGAQVHHMNGTKEGPIVICQDAAYHKLLHVRMRALAACGRSCSRQTWSARFSPLVSAALRPS